MMILDIFQKKKNTQNEFINVGRISNEKGQFLAPIDEPKSDFSNYNCENFVKKIFHCKFEI